MRRLVFAAALVALAAVGVGAQEAPRVEVFGGYAYGGSGSHGWDGSVAFNAVFKKQTGMTPSEFRQNAER